MTIQFFRVVTTHFVLGDALLNFRNTTSPYDIGDILIKYDFSSNGKYIS